MDMAVCFMGFNNLNNIGYHVHLLSKTLIKIKYDNINNLMDIMALCNDANMFSNRGTNIILGILCNFTIQNNIRINKK